MLFLHPIRRQMPQFRGEKTESLLLMPSSTFDARAIAQIGFEALHKGDAHKARESFERVVAAGRADAAVHAALGSACRRLDDKTSALAAAEKALALDPRNLRALILKADHFAEKGDARAAASFYQFALKTAPPTNQLPPDLRGELIRAANMCGATRANRILLGAMSRQALLAGRRPRVSCNRSTSFSAETNLFRQPRISFLSANRSTTGRRFRGSTRSKPTGRSAPNWSRS